MDKFKAETRKLRLSQTSAEAMLWQALRNRRLARWKFRRQHPIDRYVVDFVTLDGKLIVEVDGVTHAEASERARDKIRTDLLEACGFGRSGLAANLAPLAGRGRIASSDAIRVRGYRSKYSHRSGVCPSPQPSPRKNGERERTALAEAI